jgi:hypothetical protein
LVTGWQVQLVRTARGDEKSGGAVGAPADEGPEGKLLSPASRRACIDHVRSEFKVSERRVCRVLGQGQKRPELIEGVQGRALDIFGKAVFLGGPFERNSRAGSETIAHIRLVWGKAVALLRYHFPPKMLFDHRLFFLICEKLLLVQRHERRQTDFDLQGQLSRDFWS